MNPLSDLAVVVSLWTFKFYRNMNERELVQVSDLIILLDSTRLCTAVEDRTIWKLEITGPIKSKGILLDVSLGKR